jgi:hypothetical protein
MDFYKLKNFWQIHLAFLLIDHVDFYYEIHWVESNKIQNVHIKLFVSYTNSKREPGRSLIWSPVMYFNWYMYVKTSQLIMCLWEPNHANFELT